MSSCYNSIATPLISPPPSPPDECSTHFMTDDQKVSLNGESQSESSNKLDLTKIEITNYAPGSQHRFRMRVCDVPKELMDLIKASEKIPRNVSKATAALTTGNLTASSDIMGSTKDTVSICPNNGRVTSTPNQTQSANIDDRGPIKNLNDKRRKTRKNPYPIRAPSKSSPGITLKVDVFTPFKEDPQALLHSDDPPASDPSTPLLFSDMFSSADETSESSSRNNSKSLNKRQRNKIRNKTKRSVTERKRKGNSLARVMADRGLLEATFTPVANEGEAKTIRIPPPPPMQFEELMENIDQLDLDTDLLDRINPKVNWKGQPLTISHLPHYNSLHPKEAHVASTLRLTPVQYLTSKNTLVSSARRYTQKSLPFRKSDAQKLLRIDVNKASKLWEFFMQVKWI
ncbi:328_t:CDS:1 [Dentiscutata heterogama]|uniref:328_t:CDS:1 n=1 Tax=Dentiscutata heterogama TaxID=1316150 RepID=A0ACA9K0C6_9GLOM|nr:328_t:CDS:1 [Dentiscutata heterogama]